MYTALNRASLKPPVRQSPISRGQRAGASNFLLILNKCGLMAKTCYLFYSAYGFKLLVGPMGLTKVPTLEGTLLYIPLFSYEENNNDI